MVTINAFEILKFLSCSMIVYIFFFIYVFVKVSLAHSNEISDGITSVPKDLNEYSKFRFPFLNSTNCLLATIFMIEIFLSISISIYILISHI